MNAFVEAGRQDYAYNVSDLFTDPGGRRKSNEQLLIRK